MNQKRITNQILEQKNFTLNSTLNYLFNISNMKKLFSYLLISSMVVLSSCTNYDDQFDDLNSQINSLKSQIEGFSSLSSGLTALQGTVSSLQSAVAALPKTATPATDISGLEASVAALQTQLASASTSAEVTALTTQLTAAQAALADAIAANATAADANATSIAGNATAIANLLTELETLATSLTAIKADLAAADTSAEVTALTTALAAAQADLTALLEQNKIYTGNVIINNASTLAAVEALGDKVSIVNGDVYITQSSTAIDATKLQAVVSKMTTVTGAVSYTHSGTGVTAVNFDKLASAGSLKLDQEAPVSLPALASAGAVVVVNDTKLTSVSMPALATVTSFNDGTTANKLGGSKVTSIDLGSLTRYDVAAGALELVLSTTGDTTLDLASLTTTDSTTGLVEKLDLTVTGGDDLSLPLFVKGDISATNVKTVVLPKFIYTNSTYGTLAVTASKLESIAMHEVRGSFTLSSASKLASVDFIGTIDTSVTSRSVGGSVTISGTNPSLTKASFAGILAGASVTGATDLTDITTSGMIRAFTLDGSDDIETLTLGHKNITGITGTNGENAGNASSLTIQNNTALTSFSASELASLGTLIVKNNASLTAFTLKSTLSLGTALSSAGAAASETVNVDISGNDLTGSVQRPSAFNVSPAVTGKITQASLNGISTYLKAVEAAIKHGALTGSTGADASGWDRTTGLYTAAVTSGGSNTGYALTKANVVIDNLTSNVDADGVDAGDSSDYNVIAITTAGVGVAGQGEKQAKATAYFTKAAGSSYVVSAAGASVSLTPASSTYASDIATLVGDSEFAAFGVALTHTTGLNKRVKLAFSGKVSSTSVLSMTWNQGAVSHTVTATAKSNGSIATADITELANAFNTYNLGTASATLTDAQAVASGTSMLIYAGTYSGTTLKVDIDGTASFPGVTAGRAAAEANNPAAITAAYSIESDEAFIATATSSSTTTTSTGLNLSVTIGGTAATAVLTPTTAHATLIADKQAVVTDSGKFLNNHSITSAAVPAVNANITMRATWL